MPEGGNPKAIGQGTWAGQAGPQGDMGVTTIVSRNGQLMAGAVKCGSRIVERCIVQRKVSGAEV